MIKEKSNRIWAAQYGSIQRRIGLWYGMNWITSEQFNRYTDRLSNALLKREI